MEFIRTDAGARIVDALVGEAVMAPVRDLIARVSDSGAPILVSANAYERGGLNAIPAALAKLLGERLAFPFRTRGRVILLYKQGDPRKCWREWKGSP